MTSRTLTSACFAVLLGLAQVASAALNVTNVTAVQRSGTKKVDIGYDLTTEGTGPVTVTVDISDDGGATFTVKAQTLTGDVGTNVSAGTGKRMTWDAGIDAPSVAGIRYVAKVTATEGGPAANGRIWFLSPKTYGDADYEIWSMEPDGTDAKKMVELPFGQRLGPFAVNPSGTEVVFVHDESNSYDYADRKLKSRKVAGGLASVIDDFGNNAIGTCVWSPDGTAITFPFRRYNSSREEVWTLDIRTLLWADARGYLPLETDYDSQATVQSLYSIWALSWRPDGRQMYFLASTSHSANAGQLHTMAADFTKIQRIGNATDIRWATLSPDGATLAYARADKGVFTAKPDGTRETQIATQKAWRVVWSPDGKELVLQDQDTAKLFRLKPDGTGLTAIVPNGNTRIAAISPAWVRR
jgi:WD40 repeat protein